MQLFPLDPDNHKKNAEAHVNAHVVKIPLEVAQMLSIALHVLLGPERGAELAKSAEIYKYAKSYGKHPCVRWILESRANFTWTFDYGMALCDEYYYRYGACHKNGPRQLACRKVIERCAQLLPASFADNGRTPFAQAIADKALHVPGDARAAYRLYYQSAEKAHIRFWKDREPPSWFADPAPVRKEKKRKRSVAE